ncbi:MAG: Fe-S protein assembly co-chaperone HscB [Granulosicoccus sp.]
MQLDLRGSFFELFDIPDSFRIDKDHLVSRYRELQTQLHPDKFASGTDAERRWSLQAASYVNEGYQTLLDDLSRAAYILQLNGIAVDEETDTQMDPMFLMEQMELRESLELAETSADPLVKLASIRKQLRSLIEQQSDQYSKAAGRADWSASRTITRQWQFLDKLLREAKSVEERLDV